MPGDKIVNKTITDIANQVKSLAGWKIINIGQKEYMRLLPWNHSIFNAGPAEFLGLFQNASFVITNSFHGTAFSNIFRKPFLVPINNNLSPERTLSSRVTSLLQTLSLEDRLLPVDKSDFNTRLLNIEYNKTAPILEQLKEKSIEYLKSSLEVHK